MSVVKNFLYNSSITVSTYIFSFITFPYVTRVLGVQSMGVFGYVDNVINYFLLFLMLGVSSVGTREIASSKNDFKKRSEVFFNLFAFLLLSTFIVTIVYTICIFAIPQLKQYENLFIIGYVKLLFTPFLFEWIFAGLQDFRYIAIRSLFVKLLYVISVFFFVNSKEDIDTYFFLTCFTVFANSVVNIVALQKYVTFSRDIKIKLDRYLKLLFKLGSFTIIVSLYSTFNYIYLRAVSSEYQVGIYYTSIRIYSIILGFYSAFTNVMMPRISELLEDGDKSTVNRLLDKSFLALFTFSIPLLSCSVLLAPFIIRIIAGEGYYDAVIPMTIVMPLLLIAGINQVNGIQILMPMRKDNVLLWTSLIAAIAGVIFNFVFAAKLGAVGCCMALFASETTGCVSGVIYALKSKLFVFPIRLMLNHLLSAIPYFIICLLVTFLIEGFVIKYVILLLIFTIYFILSQMYILKNPLITGLVSKLIR